MYGSLIVPEAVDQELRQATTTCPAIEITQFAGFEVKQPRSNPRQYGVPEDLDLGEMQAITLAIELRADLLLMDERKGTEVSQKLRLGDRRSLRRAVGSQTPRADRSGPASR